MLGFIVGLRILQPLESQERLLILSGPKHVRLDFFEALSLTAETDSLVSDFLRI